MKKGTILLVPCVIEWEQMVYLLESTRAKYYVWKRRDTL